MPGRMNYHPHHPNPQNYINVRYLFLFGLTISLGAILSSCISENGYSGHWVYNDLRIIDAIDSKSPECDLTAISAKVSGTEIQIRYELLDGKYTDDFTLFLFIGDQKSQNDLPVLSVSPYRHYEIIPWNISIEFNPHGRHIARTSDNQQIDNLRLKYIRNPITDIYSISFDKYILPSSQNGTIFQLQVYSKIDETVCDVSEPFDLGSPPPPKTNYILALWDTMPAYTPAQALRSWFGAHSGPQTTRHGLYFFLKALSENDSHVFLLDLKTPEALSALDYIDDTNMIQQMADKNLITLPQVGLNNITHQIPISLQERALDDSKFYGEIYQLSNSDIAFLPEFSAQLGSNISEKFLFTLEIDQLQQVHTPVITQLQYGENNFLILEQPVSEQVNQMDGFPIEVRRSFIEQNGNHQINKQNHIILLGGSLPNSNWGNYLAAKQALEYLSLRPWLENLDATDLGELIFDHSSKVNLFSTENISGSISQIKTKRSEISIDYTWQAFRSLQSPAPPYSEKQKALRMNGLWMLELFSELNNWAMNPHHSEICNKDYDLDGYRECVISNNTTFAIVNPQKNILHLLAVQNPCSSQSSSETEDCGYTQIIGPTSQIILGQADSTTWNLSSGAYADPGTLVGAQFLTPKNLGHTTDNSYHLMSKIGSFSYQLLNYGIKITGNNLGCLAETDIVKIPLIIAPENRF
jgi:hypothetical protein